MAYKVVNDDGEIIGYIQEGDRVIRRYNGGRELTLSMAHRRGLYVRVGFIKGGERFRFAV